jgi:phosphoribosylformimino-5-aminoimidazole carboxamide ribotide isomerase
MIYFPAIDLKDGQCVRLFQGDMHKSTIFNNDPSSQALEFEKLGFKYLHLVDLDGAVVGKTTNIIAIQKILANVKIPIQLGGGIRTLENIENILSWGIDRVILGTIALTNPDLVQLACKKFPQKIVIGIDAKNSMVATHGWVETSLISTLELAKKFEDCGVCSIIYTDISRDGTMQGFDYAGTKNLAKNLSIPIIASGGVNSNEDLKKIQELEEFGVAGAIIGRALYEKKIDVNLLIS